VQWTITAYTLTLASLILLGGATGDRYGRGRMFQVGVVWFGVASLRCAVAPNAAWRIAARALRGVGGALLTPASPAIIEASFAHRQSQGRGNMGRFSGIATSLAPILGGWLIERSSWRAVFLINLPLAGLILVVALGHVPETRDDAATGRIDVVGTALECPCSRDR